MKDAVMPVYPIIFMGIYATIDRHGIATKKIN